MRTLKNYCAGSVKLKEGAGNKLDKAMSLLTSPNNPLPPPKKNLLPLNTSAGILKF